MINVPAFCAKTYLSQDIQEELESFRWLSAEAWRSSGNDLNGSIGCNLYELSYNRLDLSRYMWFWVILKNTSSE